MEGNRRGMKILCKWVSTETYAKELESRLYTSCLEVGVFWVFFSWGDF